MTSSGTSSAQGSAFRWLLPRPERLVASGVEFGGDIAQHVSRAGRTPIGINCSHSAT
jgi:hypothetical protein